LSVGQQTDKSVTHPLAHPNGSALTQLSGTRAAPLLQEAIRLVRPLKMLDGGADDWTRKQRFTEGLAFFLPFSCTNGLQPAARESKCGVRATH